MTLFFAVYSCQKDQWFYLLISDRLWSSDGGCSGHVPLGVEEGEPVAEGRCGQDNLALVGSQTGHDVQKRILM